MAFKNIHLALAKTFGLERFIKRGGRNKQKGESGSVNHKRRRPPSWMTPAVSHGCHTVERRSPAATGSPEVVVQREQGEEGCEWWFYGVFHARIGAGLTEYLQDHLFNGKLKESQMRRKSKQTMKKAHLSARAKIMMDATAEEDPCNLGSASAIVINGERLVIANMGDYKAVICKDGEAFPVGGTRPRWQKMNHWSCKLFPGSRKQAGAFKDSRSSQIAVMSERIYGTTELVILASTGVWEVMKEQEAVNLIRHIEDPQKAAECLAEEASTRMSRSKIACLIIRFD
ncbi:unnamed protein product [Cuscuta epithymum]|uniref:PPM-type phosphatase domain-containing protein n=2 Tax=Cuscuta epithymum TaxID=186058 RepID=A0AAV0EU01_9ASTE|nr:unnamed protein product [Cuscuta epithymum]